MTELTNFLLARDLHVGHICAVSPRTDPLVYLEPRARQYQSRHFSGGRVCDASPTSFLSHFLERHGGPREARLSPLSS